MRSLSPTTAVAGEGRYAGGEDPGSEEGTVAAAKYG